MNPKLDNLDVNSSADEIAEYIDRFNFWIDTKETSDDKAFKYLAGEFNDRLAVFFTLTNKLRFQDSTDGDSKVAPATFWP